MLDADERLELVTLETCELDEELIALDELAIDEFIELLDAIDEETEEFWLADCDEIDDRLDCTILDEFVWSLLPPPPQADSASPIIETNPSRLKKC